MNAAFAERDFWGYGGKAPDIRWPEGAKVAVSFVVNFEEGAEFSIADHDDHNEAIYEVEHRLEGQPDPCLDSHFEYGARAGWWRVMDLLDRFEALWTLTKPAQTYDEAARAFRKGRGGRRAMGPVGPVPETKASAPAATRSQREPRRGEAAGPGLLPCLSPFLRSPSMARAGYCTVVGAVG